MKSSVEDIRRRFDADMDRFSNLDTGQSGTVDAPLAMALVAQAAATTTPHARHVLDVGCGAGNYTLKLLESLPGLDVTLFGCACFFLNGNVLVGVWKDALIARVGPDEGEAALREPHVRQFDITGKPMRNWVAVEPEGVEDDDQLRDWIRRAEAFVGALPAKQKWSRE